MKHVSIRVTGNVQGVFFRATTKEIADGLNLKGWVRNNRDGSVLIEAEGEADPVDQLIKWCSTGPPRAVVEEVEVVEGAVRGYPGFDIVKGN